MPELVRSTCCIDYKLFMCWNGVLRFVVPVCPFKIYKYLHVTGEVLYRPWCGFHTCTGRFSLVLLTAFAGVLNSWADAPPLLHLVLVRSQCRAPADTMTTYTGGLNSARTGPVAALLRRHNCTRGMIAVSPEGGTRCGQRRLSSLAGRLQRSAGCYSVRHCAGGCYTQTATVK